MLSVSTEQQEKSIGILQPLYGNEYISSGNIEYASKVPSSR